MSKKQFHAWISWTDWAIFRFFFMPKDMFDINGLGFQIGPFNAEFTWGEDLETCWEDGYGIEITD